MSINLLNDESMNVESMGENQAYVSVYELGATDDFKIGLIDLDWDTSKDLWSMVVSNRVWIALRIQPAGQVLVEVEDNQGIDPPGARPG